MLTAERAALPTARGPLSGVVLAALRRPPEVATFPTFNWATVDPFGEDMQLALHLCYELHYQGFKGVNAAWEWDPELLRFRAAMERVFLDGLRKDTPGGTNVLAELDKLLVEPLPGNGVSHFLRDHGQWWHVREFFACRSIYHLKEADPHTWVIPRLRGRAKASILAVQWDEYGAGRPEQAHAQLFADLLVAAGLSAEYLHYLDHVPACVLATVNMMSLFGLHRRLRGALVGHLTAAEITTSPAATRMDQALVRLGASDACRRFYTEHIEADAVHEQVMRHDVTADLLKQEPELAADVVLGIQATNLVEDRLTRHLLDSWRAGRSALRMPLAGADLPPVAGVA